MKKSWIMVAAAVPLVVLASIAVWKVSGDDSRRQGALGTGEAVTLSWRGDWSADAQYAPGNVVSFEGASYVAETEKLATPKPECPDCGWTRMAVESVPAETKAASAELSGYEIVKGDLRIPSGSNTGTVVVSCPAGKKVFGGGSLNVWVDLDGPVGPGTDIDNGGLYGWKFHATLQGGGATLFVYATCANSA